MTILSLLEVSTLKLPMNAELKKSSIRNSHIINKANKNTGSSPIQQRSELISLHKFLFSSMLGFQILSSYTTDSVSAAMYGPSTTLTVATIEPIKEAIFANTNSALEATKKETQELISSLSSAGSNYVKDIQPFVNYLQNTLNDINKGVPVSPELFNSIKVSYRDKQFFVDFNIPDLGIGSNPLDRGSALAVEQVLKSMNALVDKKPLLTTTIQSATMAPLKFVNPYYKEFIQAVNERVLSESSIQGYSSAINELINVYLPKTITLLTNYKYLIPLGFILFYLADLVQSRNQYKDILDDQEKEVNLLKSTVQKKQIELSLKEQMIANKEAEINKVKSIYEQEKEAKLQNIEMEKQKLNEIQRQKALEQETVEKKKTEMKQKLDIQAESLAIKGKQIFKDSITNIINEYTDNNQDLPSFEVLIFKPVKDAEDRLVEEIKFKNLTEIDTKYLIESVVKKINTLILAEMASIELMITAAQAKRDYEKKQAAESEERKAKLMRAPEGSSESENALLYSSQPSVASATASNTPKQSFSSSSSSSSSSVSQSALNKLVGAMIEQVESDITRNEEAEEIALIEAKQKRVDDLDDRKMKIQQNEEQARREYQRNQARLEYERKLNQQRELKKREYEKLQKTAVATATAELAHPVTTIISSSTKTVMPAMIEEDLEDPEEVAEAEANLWHEAKLEYEAKLKNQREQKRKDYENLQKRTVTTINSSTSKTVWPALIEEDLENSEEVAEAEAIMRLEEEALRRVESELAKQPNLSKGVKINSNFESRPAPPAAITTPTAVSAASAPAKRVATKRTSKPKTEPSTASTETTASVTGTATKTKRKSAAKTATATSASSSLPSSPVAVAVKEAPIPVMPLSTATATVVTSPVPAPGSEELIKLLRTLSPSQVSLNQLSYLLLYIN